MIERTLEGELRSRRAIEKFLDGNSGREFRCWSLEGNPRLRPFEAGGRSWYHRGLGWISNQNTVEELDAQRKRDGGILVLFTFE